MRSSGTQIVEFWNNLQSNKKKDKKRTFNSEVEQRVENRTGKNGDLCGFNVRKPNNSILINQALK